MPEQNLSILIDTLTQTRATKEVENKFIISELTMAQQREILVTVFDPIETPVKLNNAFNKILKDCIVVKDNSDITVDEKPYLIRELRDLSVGPEFTKTTKVDGEEEKDSFKFTKIDYKKINKIKKDEELRISKDVKILLKIPSIDRDTVINNTLLKALSQYKRSTEQKKEELDKGYITSLYLMYELIKYINKIYVGEIEYNFDKLLINEQLKVVNNLPHNFIATLTDFIQQVKDCENMSFTATNLKTNEKIVLGLDYNIFSKDL